MSNITLVSNSFSSDIAMYQITIPTLWVKVKLPSTAVEVVSSGQLDCCYSDDPSSNPAEDNTLYCVKITSKEQKSIWVWPILKTI